MTLTQKLDSLLKDLDRLRVLRQKLDLLSKDHQRCIASNRHDLLKLIEPVILNSKVEMFTTYSKIIETVAQFQLSNQQGNLAKSA